MSKNPPPPPSPSHFKNDIGKHYKFNLPQLNNGVSTIIDLEINFNNDDDKEVGRVGRGRKKNQNEGSTTTVFRQHFVTEI